MKQQTKKNVVNYGLKISLAVSLVRSIAEIPKETGTTNKVVLAGVYGLVAAAQYIIIDEAVKAIFDE